MKQETRRNTGRANSRIYSHTHTHAHAQIRRDPQNGRFKNQDEFFFRQKNTSSLGLRDLRRVCAAKFDFFFFFKSIRPKDRRRVRYLSRRASCPGFFVSRNSISIAALGACNANNVSHLAHIAHSDRNERKGIKKKIKTKKKLRFATASANLSSFPEIL